MVLPFAVFEFVEKMLKVLFTMRKNDISKVILKVFKDNVYRLFQSIE